MIDKGGVQMRACSWPGNDPIMQQYHDKEWCILTNDDRYIFEMLSLEGAQAGLSWSIVLSKREAYQEAFRHFDIAYCAEITDLELEEIREQYQVIKHAAKLRSVRKNAQAIIQLQEEFGSFSNFLWSYVNHQPIINKWDAEGQVPAQTELSKQLSKDMKKRGFTFVGPVILYSFMQAIGIVDDHIHTCPFHTNNKSKEGNENGI